MKTYKPSAFVKLRSATFSLVLAMIVPAVAADGDQRSSAAPQIDAMITDGGLDPTFNAGRFTNGWVRTAVLQPDGKLLIGGGFSKVHGVSRLGVARLNPDGTLDTSFDPGNATRPDVRVLALQPQDGKILVGYHTSAPDLNLTVVRFNSDGSRDLAFDLNRAISLDGADDGTGQATNRGSISGFHVQPDGKIVAVGSFFYIVTGPGTSVTRSCIARFNSDGTFDPTLDPGSGFSSGFTPNASRIVRQSVGPNAGKLVVQGRFETFDGHFASGFVRLNPNGSFDNTFSAGLGTEPSSVSGLFVQSDDQILVFGSFLSFNDFFQSGIVRLKTWGALDTSFTPNFQQYSTPSTISAVAQQSDGKLLVGGFFHSLAGVPAHNLARLELNGVRDPSFADATAGPGAYDVAVVLIRPGDNKLFAGGYFSTYGGVARNNIAWLNADGSLDSTFNGLSGVTDYAPQVHALATQPDGKVLVGGFFSSFDGMPRQNLVRLNPDSTVDSSFGPGLIIDGSVRALWVQSDGKILIAGFIRSVNGVARGRVARLNADGTLDLSFNAGGDGADDTIFAVMQDAQGSVYVGGAFKNFNGVPRGALAKLTPDGTLDPQFSASGPNNIVYAITTPDDAGRIIIAGSFTSYGGVAAGRIARITGSTGQISAVPQSGGFNGLVRALARTADGKIIAAGSFSRLSGVIRWRVARLTNDLLSDFSLNAPELSAGAGSVAVQNDKVYVGLISSPANPAGQLLRLTSSGALDPSFMTGSNVAISPSTAYTSFVPTVAALNLQPDGKLLVGGTFNNYNGTERICLARLTDSRLAFNAVSRKTHGTSGTHDIPLPSTGSRGVECRSGGANNSHQVVFTFPAPVSFTDAAVTSGSGSVMGASGSGTTTITVDLANVANAQTITLRLAAVTNGESTADLTVPMGILAGDTTGNGSVTTSDIGQTKGQSGQPVSATNFRSDVTANGGSINASDIGLVKARSGTQLP
jgi:uncharacterized delta-60 repeat protein